MSCVKCDPIREVTDTTQPHVVRECANCGQAYPVRETAKFGHGFKVEKGDRVVIPAGFIKLAANPLKASGQMTPHGLDWFAQLVFGTDIAKTEAKDNFLSALEKIQESNEELFKHSERLAHLDPDGEGYGDAVYELLSDDRDSIEWWAVSAAVFCSIAADAINTSDAHLAAWAIACAERFRALALFKEHFHEVVFMGHSAGRLVQLMRHWDAHKVNGEEGFWQTLLSDNSYAFSQLFAAPVTFIQDRAYVGGTQLDGKDARYLDFMLSGGSSNHAILVEIKTPTTNLLGRKYRGNVYPPSRELGGAVVQVNDYCDVLRRNVEQVTRARGLELDTFNPRRIILIGNYETELTDKRKRSSFELFRSSLVGVEIVTFDEFFRKVDQLARLFNIVRTKPATTE